MHYFYIRDLKKTLLSMLNKPELSISLLAVSVDTWAHYAMPLEVHHSEEDISFVIFSFMGLCVEIDLGKCSFLFKNLKLWQLLFISACRVYLAV